MFVQTAYLFFSSCHDMALLLQRMVILCACCSQGLLQLPALLLKLRQPICLRGQTLLQDNRKPNTVSVHHSCVYHLEQNRPLFQTQMQFADSTLYLNAVVEETFMPCGKLAVHCLQVLCLMPSTLLGMHASHHVLPHKHNSKTVVSCLQCGKLALCNLQVLCDSTLAGM